MTAPGTVIHHSPPVRRVTRHEELPSAECFFMVIRRRLVSIIACTPEQGRAYMIEAAEHMATWTPEGQRNTRLRLRYGKPQMSERKLYYLTSAYEYFYNWRERKKK
jgi:hypothetical protein